MKKHHCFAVLLILVLVSCTGVQTPVVSPLPSTPTLTMLSLNPTTTKTATPAIAPTATITLTNTPTTTPTFTPSPLPTLSANWLPLPFQKISVNNVDKVKFQKVVGIGGNTALSRDGKYLAMATTRLALYDFINLKEIPLAKDPDERKIDQRISAIGFSPDGQFLVAVSNEVLYGELRIWGTGDGKLVYANGDTFEWLHSLAFSPDGSTLALGSAGGLIILLDTRDYKIIRYWKAHTWIVSDFAFSPDGKKLASVSYDNTFKVWDFPSGKKLFETKGEKTDEPITTGIWKIKYSSDGGFISTGSGYGFVELWKESESPFNVERVKVWKAEDNGGINDLSLSTDNRYLVTSSWSGTQFWSLQDGSLLRILRKESCDLSPDETLLFCGNSLWGVGK